MAQRGSYPLVCVFCIVSSISIDVAGVNDGRNLTPYRRLKIDPLLVG
jgi:hypothetical protein